MLVDMENMIMTRFNAFFFKIPTILPMIRCYQEGDARYSNSAKLSNINTVSI